MSPSLGHRVESPAADAGQRRPLAVWLAGRCGWEAHAALGERLAGEMALPAARSLPGRPGRRGPTLVIAEIEPCISIGRLGSRADVAIDADELRSRRLAVRFTGRGGGAVLHGPGQVCVTLVAALADLGLDPLDVGGLLARLEAGLTAALGALRCGQPAPAGVDGVAGRSGLLAAVGVAVRRGVVAHGAFVNVCPDLALQRRVVTARPAGAAPLTMGSLEADLRRRVRLPEARTLLVQHLAEAFACDRVHVHAGFPLPLAAGVPPAEVVSRVG